MDKEDDGGTGGAGITATEWVKRMPWARHARVPAACLVPGACLVRPLEHPFAGYNSVEVQATLAGMEAAYSRATGKYVFGTFALLITIRSLLTASEASG